MVVVIIVFLLLLLAAAGFGLFVLVEYQSDAETVRDNARDADVEVEQAYRSARHQMNDAAGQSWRNLAG